MVRLEVFLFFYFFFYWLDGRDMSQGNVGTNLDSNTVAQNLDLEKMNAFIFSLKMSTNLSQLQNVK